MRLYELVGNNIYRFIECRKIIDIRGLEEDTFIGFCKSDGEEILNIDGDIYDFEKVEKYKEWAIDNDNCLTVWFY